MPAVITEALVKSALHTTLEQKELRKGADTKGCMVALHPDPAAAKRLAVGTEPADRLHVTLAYLGDAVDVDQKKLNRLVAGWAASTPRVKAIVSGAGKFTAGPEPVAHLSVDAPSLSAHREHLVRGIESAGLPLKTEHGFTPHMTLEYGSGADRAVQAAEGLNPKLHFTHAVVSHAGKQTRHELSGVY